MKEQKIEIGNKSNAFLNVHLYTDGYCAVKEDFPYDFVSGYEELHFFYNIKLPEAVNDPSVAINTSHIAVSILETILDNLIFRDTDIAHDVSETFLLAINDIRYLPQMDTYRENKGTVETVVQYFPFVPIIDNYSTFFVDANERNN